MGLRRATVPRAGVLIAAALAVAGTALLVPGGPGAGPSVRRAEPARATDYGPPPITDVESLLDRMGTAVVAGDERGFLSVVDPAATQVRDAQRRVFRALRRLPVETLTYEWPERRPAPSAAGDRPGDVVAAVQRRYWLQGWDAGPVVESRALVFRPSGGRWTLVADREGPGAPAPEPWVVTDVVVERSGPVLLVGDARTGPRLKRLGERIEREIPAIRRLWAPSDPRAGWSGRAVVYVIGSADFLDRWFGELTPSGGTAEDRGGDAAFDGEVAAVPGVMSGAPVVAGRRMVLSPEVLEYEDATLRPLLRHELTHLATLPARPEDTPAAWLVEGVAEYTAYRGTGGDPAEGVAALGRRGLPRPMWAALRRSSYRPDLELDLADLYTGGGDAVARRYSDSWLAALFVADRYGEAALRRLLRADVWREAGSAPEREAAALRTVLDTGRDAFVEEVADYARSLRRRFV